MTQSHIIKTAVEKWNLSVRLYLSEMNEHPKRSEMWDVTDVNRNVRKYIFEAPVIFNKTAPFRTKGAISNNKEH